jgi:hypothetical protein
MNGIWHPAVYNPRITFLGMQIFWLRLGRAAAFLLVAICLSGGAMVAASDWTTTEGQLAAKIAAVTGPGAVALEVTNRSSLSRADFEEIGRGLRSQLVTLGLQFVNADRAAAAVEVAFSEDLESYVWVAEIHQATNESSVVIVSSPRSGGPLAAEEASGVIIHKALLWVQAEPILDVAVIDGNPTHMAVLDANRISLYKLAGTRWQSEQWLPVTHTRAWARDLRGRLVLRKDHLFDAYLPGVFCRSTASIPLVLNCSESDDPWPLAPEPFNLSAFFAPSRNYFTGALAPGLSKQTSAPPFYSAAPLPRDQYSLWLLAAVDGQVHLLDGVTDQKAGALDWGSDLASIHSGCGSGWDVLATSRSDGPADSVRAFAVADREPAAVSSPLEFDGRITALWAEANGNNAIAVSRNLDTGNYEAFRLSFTCGQ